MDLKRVKIPAGGKLFKISNFTFMYKGVNYAIEVDEFSDGTFTAHGEHATDKSSVFEPVSGKSVEDCLTTLIGKIQSRA